MSFQDHLNRTFTLHKQPQRIVSLVPSLTELLHDLGLEKRIVGVTRFCVHPAHYKSTKAIVGGTKKVNFNKIKALNPDFIICSKEENTPEIVNVLDQWSTVFVTNIHTFQEALDFINEIGLIIGKRGNAQRLVNKIVLKYNEFSEQLKDKHPVKTAYFIWKNPWMVAGSPTFINSMMIINRLENVFANKGRYPEINIKHLKQQSHPELLLFSSEPYPFKEKDAFEVLQANEKTCSVFVDGEYFSWYGSRLLKAFDYFKAFQKELSTFR